MENNQQQSFWQFSDQLRDQNNNGLATLSLNNDSIWGNSYISKKPERRNFDTRVNNTSRNEPGLRNFDSFDSTNAFNPKESGFNFNEGFKKFDKLDSTKPFKSNETELNKGFRKFDIRVGGELNSVNSNTLNAKETNFNGFNHNWKIGGADLNGFNLDWKSNLNTGFNNIGAYSKPSVDYKLDNNRNLNNNNNNNFNVNTKGYFKKSEDVHHFNQHNNNNNHGVGKFGKKNKNSNKDSNKESEKDNKNSVEKRFKTLPPSESLPRDETIGGYIFVCNNDTMEENLQRQLFGLPPRYRDSVRSITPGLPLFLYNYSTHQLHGIYEASSFGGTNIDASAWEDKKNPGESRFPAQVRVMTRKICEPLEEDSFRPILHHYDGPKFRLELNIPEVLALLDIFSEK